MNIVVQLIVTRIFDAHEGWRFGQVSDGDYWLSGGGDKYPLSPASPLVSWSVESIWFWQIPLTEANVRKLAARFGGNEGRFLAAETVKELRDALLDHARFEIDNEGEAN